MMRFSAGVGSCGIALMLGCNSGYAGPSDPVAETTPNTISWHDPIEIASGNAHRGPWRMNRSEWDFVDDPTVAMNRQGYIGVAWTDHPKQDIHFQLYDPDGEAQLAEPVNVSRSSSIFSWLPRMIITDADDAGQINVYLLWQEIVFSGGSHGGEILFARSTDGGRSFSAPLNLSNTTAGAGKGRLSARSWHNGSLDIVKDSQGTLYAAWTEYEGSLWFSRSANSGESFSDPLRIEGSGDENPARGPSLALGRQGEIFLAWTVGEDRSADIHFSTSHDDGRTFDEPRTVHESDGHADAPKLMVDSEGIVHLVYAESEQGPGGQYHIRYTRASDESLTFEQPREIVASRAAGADSVHFPMLRVDGDDNLYLTWEHYPNRRGRSRGLGFAYSADGGETFTSPALVPGAGDQAHGFNGSQQGLLMNKLAVNEHGRIAVVNSTYRQNDSSHIWLIRGGFASSEEDH